MNPQSDADDLIETALSTYPLADLPPNFSRRVMRQVRAIPPSSRFRLTWMDFALGLFVAMLPGIGFIVWIFLPHQVVLDLRFQWMLFQSNPLQPVLLLSLAAAALLLFFAVLLSIGLLLRPRFTAH
jgi:hypothetical protein